MTLCDQLAEIGSRKHMSKIAFPLEDLMARIYKRIEKQPNQDGMLKNLAGKTLDKVGPIIEQTYDKAHGAVSNIKNKISNLPQGITEKGVQLFKRIEKQPGHENPVKRALGTVADRIGGYVERLNDATGDSLVKGFKKIESQPGQPGLVSRLLGKGSDLYNKGRAMVGSGVQAIDNASIKARNLVDNTTGAIGRTGTRVLDSTAKGFNNVTDMAQRGYNKAGQIVGRLSVPSPVGGAARSIKNMAVKPLPRNPFAIAALAGLGIPAGIAGGYALSK